MAIKSPTEELLVKVKGGVAILTLNRPDKLNALGTLLFGAISKVCQEISADEKIKVVVITGAGRGFCSGADVSGHPGIRDMILDKPLRKALKKWPYEALVNPVAYEMLGLWECIKPTIAAVNGVAAGGGLGIAAACDMRIASDKARFIFHYQTMGLIPDAGNTYLIPRIIGFDKALKMYLTDASIDAQEAFRIGLVTDVVPHEQLMKITMDLARKIAKGPGLAQVLTKRGMRVGLQNTFRDQLDYESYAENWVRNTEDFRNAVHAFREGKTPKFTGR